MKKIYFTALIVWLLNVICNGQNPQVQNLLNDVRLDSLTNFVKQLSGEKSVKINGVADTIKSRHYQTIGNEKAFQFLKQEFIRYGYQIDSFAFNTNGKNLFAIKTGYKYPNRKFMLGAHYDNLPTAPIAPGADDNASGCSTVLEAGRIFRNYNFPYSIVFALWDEEEPGLLGSTAYVRAIGLNNDTLMGYINVDMLGWDGNNDSIVDINTKNIAHSAALAERSKNCNTIYNIRLNVHILNPGEESSDHASFWSSNYTAIAIGEEHHTDFYPYWHTIRDSLVHFNLSFYQKCSRLAYATLADLSLDTVNTVGLSENNGVGKFQLYPNPFKETFSLSFATPVPSQLCLTIVNTLGEICYMANLPEGTNKHTIQMDPLRSGIFYYRVKLLNGQIIEQGKLIKIY